MKSLFTMGFFTNDVFRAADGPSLGQVSLDLPTYLASLNDAMARYRQVTAWATANPNYVQQLGGQGQYFQTLLSSASGRDFAVASNVQAVLQAAQADPSQGNPTITNDDKNTTDAFISEVSQMQGIIASAPGQGVQPATPGATLPGLISSLLPGQKPATPATVPAPAAPAAPSYKVPLYVGGGILALGLLVLLARRGE
jgi:hypothetical protein